MIFVKMTTVDIIAICCLFGITMLFNTVFVIINTRKIIDEIHACANKPTRVENDLYARLNDISTMRYTPKRGDKQ